MRFRVAILAVIAFAASLIGPMRRYTWTEMDPFFPRRSRLRFCITISRPMRRPS